MKILSFGGGVQTVALVALCGLDKFERPDHIIFADTQWETKATYEYIAKFEKWMKDRGMHLHHCTAGNIRENAITGKRFAALPFFTKNPGDIREGRLRRQCTREYKVAAVEKRIRELAGLGFRQRWKWSQAELWLGISTDEAIRMKDNRTWWLKNRWPLIDLGLSRSSCIKLIQSAGLDVPPKSACIGCPYHSDRYWRDLKKNTPEEFEDAVRFEKEVNQTKVAIKSPVFLHRKCVPLDQVVFKEEPEMFGEECEGHCGL